MRKSYNPFKMWGSYVGAIIFPIIMFFLMYFSFGILFLAVLGSASFVPSIIIGFLFGWAIHSFFRRFWK